MLGQVTSREEGSVSLDLGHKKGYEDGPLGTMVTFKASLWLFGGFGVFGFLLHKCLDLFTRLYASYALVVPTTSG